MKKRTLASEAALLLCTGAGAGVVRRGFGGFRVRCHAGITVACPATAIARMRRRRRRITWHEMG
jgi:hypothetical protein